jgi:hypothetical protein
VELADQGHYMPHFEHGHLSLTQYRDNTHPTQYLDTTAIHYMDTNTPYSTWTPHTSPCIRAQRAEPKKWSPYTPFTAWTTHTPPPPVHGHHGPNPVHGHNTPQQLHGHHTFQPVHGHNTPNLELGRHAPILYMDTTHSSQSYNILENIPFLEVNQLLV